MGRRRNPIQDPGALIPTQRSLFSLPGVQPKTDFFPPIRRTPEGLEELIDGAAEPLGTDLEFNPSTGKPSILGVSTRAETGAVLWDERLAAKTVEHAERTGTTLIGHSVVGADRPVYEKALGRSIPLHLWDDTMLMHYLCNSDFCKAPGKDEDSDDTGALGFMNLWTMSSLYTNLPQWKTCRGKACYGPCPTDDVFGYCAVDSWAGLTSYHALKADMAAKGIPWGLYRDLMELSEITDKMQRRGILIDRPYVASLEKEFDRKKMELFPFELINGKPVYKTINPKSPKQVAEYFLKHGIGLKSTEKDEIFKVLERVAKAGKWEVNKDGIHVEAGTLPEHVDALNRLYLFKSAGKGLKSWFDDRYVDALSLIHPRFIITGASTGRLASSGPNFQNIPARGFGELVRKAIIARAGFDLLKADFSQLELRMCLYLAGVDPRGIGGDAFKWLVEQSAGAFLKAAELAASSERQIAKSVSHAFDYLEGFKVLYPRDLIKASVMKEIEYGALRVYRKKYMPELERDWEFRGGIVAFTGANLAERLFGSRTLENRKKALEIQEDLFAKSFPALRKWHMKVLAEIEDAGYIKSPVGRYLALYGSAEDDAKMAAAFLGQGVSADHVQGIMLKYFREAGEVPLIQVHDELDWEIPEGWSDAQATEFISMMGAETDRLPGFAGAFKAYRGKTWLEGEMRRIV